jgi:ADP-heptose:LPS heptosyltransferase
MFGTPALRALRQRFRDAHISVLTWQSSCEVLKGNPNVDCLVPCSGTLDMARSVSRLKSADIDLVVGLSHVGSWLSAAFPGVFKVGFNSKRLGWLYAEPVPDSRTVHAIDYCLQVVRSVGAVADSRKGVGRRSELAADGYMHASRRPELHGQAMAHLGVRGGC